MVLKFIATAFLKLIKKGRGPRACLYFVRVVEECVRIGCLGTLKSLLNMLQVMRHGIAIEVVNHKSLTARGGTLHLHDPIFDVKGNDGLWFKWHVFGYRKLVIAHLRSYIEDLSIAINHDLFEKGVFGVGSIRSDVENFLLAVHN